MVSEYLIKKIKKIPYEGSWWRKSGESQFMNIAEKLGDKGFSDDEIYDILLMAYSAVSEEYGN